MIKWQLMNLIQHQVWTNATYLLQKALWKPKYSTIKDSVSQKQMNFEKLLQLMLSSSVKGRTQVAVKKLPVKKLYDI